MFSESIWKKENSILQQDANSISILKKQINKQAQIDATVQTSISEKVQNLKQMAGVFTKKLQNQKHKNQQLETIIKYMKDRMESQKIQEASFRENPSSQSLSSLENKLKKLYYDLGQVNCKTNRIAEYVQDKRSKITQNRTERVIDSGIFRNIEKELIQSQLTFKKLLIEKVRYQKEYKKSVSQYTQLKQRAEKAELCTQKDISKSKTSNRNSQDKQANSKMSLLNKFKRIQSHRMTKFRDLTIKCLDQIDYEDQKEVICVKNLLSRTGIDAWGELIYLFQHVDQINDKYFNEMNKYIDQSNEIERYLAEAKIKKNDKALNHYLQRGKLSKPPTVAKLSQQLKLQIIKQENQIQKQHKQFLAFLESQIFKKLAKQIDIQLPNQEEHTIYFQNLIQTLRILQKNTQQLIIFETSSQKLKKSYVKADTPESLNQVMSQVKRNQEILKVMKKQDFREQYHNIVKNISQKNLGGDKKKIQKKSSGFGKK